MTEKFIPEFSAEAPPVLRLVIPEGADAMVNFCTEDVDRDSYPIPDLTLAVSVEKLAKAIAIAQFNSGVLRGVSIQIEAFSQTLDMVLDYPGLRILVFPNWFTLRLETYNPMSGLRYFMELDDFFAVDRLSDLPSYLDGLLLKHTQGGVHG